LEGPVPVNVLRNRLAGSRLCHKLPQGAQPLGGPFDLGIHEPHPIKVSLEDRFDRLVGTPVDDRDGLLAHNTMSSAFLAARSSSKKSSSPAASRASTIW